MPHGWHAAAIGALCSAATLEAQPGGASIGGRIVDRSTGKGLAGAQVILLSDSRLVSADSLGHYHFSGVPAGVSQFLIRALGFPALSIIVEFTAGQRVDRTIHLDSTITRREAQTLPGLSVTAAARGINRRMAGFDRRRQTGRGQYLTEDDIVKSGAYTVSDAIRGLRGVNYECGGGRGCFIRMARAPLRCAPEYFVDDQVVNDFGPLTPIRDVIGIEVYTGPSDVPGEYGGRNAGCGVIVLWTRTGPSRRAEPKP